MGYVVMTQGKIKTMSQISVAFDHNMRLRFCENVNKDKAEQNRELLSRKESYTAFCRRRIREASRDGKKIRKDAVKAIDIVIGVSRKEAEKNPFFDLDRFCDIAKKWVCDTYGENNVAGITLHLDETAPHIHAVVVPITKDNRLCCSDFIGSPEKLSAMQDSIGAAMSPLHLRRGLKKSVAKNKDIRAHYGAIEEARTDSLPSPIEGETAMQYSIRANQVFNDEKSRNVEEVTTLKRKIDELTTLVRHPEESLDAEREDIKIQKEESSRLLKRLEKSNKALTEYGYIVTAIQGHLLPAEEERSLLVLMQKAITEARENTKDIPNGIEKGD